MKSVKGKTRMTKGEVINQDKALLLQKAKTHVTQRLLGGVTLMFLGLMIFNTIKTTYAGDNMNTNVNVNVSAGALELVNVEDMVNLGGATAGVASNVFGNLDGAVVKDYRAAGMGNWDINIYCDTLTGVVVPTDMIPNTLVSVWPSNSTRTEVVSYDINLLGNGVGTRALNGDNIFFNSDEGTTGAVSINNILFKVNVGGTLSAQDYQGIATLTVVAS